MHAWDIREAVRRRNWVRRVKRAMDCSGLSAHLRATPPQKVAGG